jgi:malate dehydrogenase (oxaloacetate-decarboxylating)
MPMHEYQIKHDEKGQAYLELRGGGPALLHDPLLNKGTAFTAEEREAFGLTGFLPAHAATLEEQLERTYENFSRKKTPIEKHIFLRSLQDRNETLFYALLLRHLEEMVPVVYTPTVGDACMAYSHLFRFARGVFVTPENIDGIDRMFENAAFRDVEMIVVTDSEGILGIGDQGAGGMGIPIGKLSLYVAGAGIPPSACLPITLDVGTDNEALLRDPVYLGLRRPRLRGEPYFALVDRFVHAIRRHFPRALLQWEDFSRQTAFTLLERYRKAIPSFNDDIQGTGAVVLAGTLAALKLTGQKLGDQVFVVYGAGAGGIGVAHQLHTALVNAGLSVAAAKEHILTLDSRGLVVRGRPGLDPYKEEFAVAPGRVRDWGLDPTGRIGLIPTIEKARATAIYGLSGHRADITEAVVRALLANTEAPLVFCLSNPTANCEADPADVYQWSAGRAIVATGSPFPDVMLGTQRLVVGQGNNAFIFPGMGLGTLAVGAREVTDGMFTTAAHRLVEFVPEERLRQRCVYPAYSALRELSKHIAIAAGESAVREGVAPKRSHDEIVVAVEEKMWAPHYLPYRLTR